MKATQHISRFDHPTYDRAQTAQTSLSRETWQYLWQRFDLAGLIELHRRSGWFDDQTDEQLAAQLVEWSVTAGYDPVSGRFGWIDSADGQFRLESNV